jgi:hypothetical protein
MWFWPVGRMSLRPDLLWLNLNLVLIIQCVYQNTVSLSNFIIPRKMFSRSTGEIYWSEQQLGIPELKFYSMNSGNPAVSEGS